MRNILAIDFGGTKIAVALINPQGKILARESCLTPAEGPEAALRWAVELADRIRAAAGPAVAVGLALPGVVDRGTGILLRSPSSGWSAVPFVRRVSQIFGLPVACDNDVNACAWAEACFGGKASEPYAENSAPLETLVLPEAKYPPELKDSAEYRVPSAKKVPGSFFWLTVSTGIGGALVVDHKVVAGAHGMAGELGHLVVNPGGALCGCGNRGCLEAEAAGPAWRRMALAALDSDPRNLDGYLGRLPSSQIDAKAIAAGARSGDRLCGEIVEKAGRMLARGLSAVYTILDPEAVYIGGGVGQALDILKPVILEQLPSLVQPAPERRFSIEPSSLGYDAALLGAAAMVLYPY